jgi:hypothetical protein
LRSSQSFSFQLANAVIAVIPVTIKDALISMPLSQSLLDERRQMREHPSMRSGR